ncbi:MFS transporter [Coralliovum pocilloporae]|uniref:MFS transporter n=1 Tax=Coralliovum pocilloporae TaxID=3066369 RepID=UPI0033076C6B
MNSVPPRKRAIGSWLLFDWAAQPFFTLITTFVFAPYFASRLADSPADGQALWGWAAGIAGLIIALLSPVLGAAADCSGRRKPWIFAFSVVLIFSSLALWWGIPGQDGSIGLVLVAFVAGTVAVEFAVVFTNAMMPSLAPREQWGRLSGYGWAAGYVSGLICLVLVLGLMIGREETGLTLLGFEPLFGLDPAFAEGDRASGPFTALWYAVFVIPLFLFVPDGSGRARFLASLREGYQITLLSIRQARKHRNAFTYLISHMIYADGLAAMFAFGGIYAALVFGWQTIEVGLFGILLTITGTIGAVLGGIADDRYGPKPVVLVSIVILIVSAVLLLSLQPDKVLWIVSVPEGGEGLFTGLSEQVFLLVGGFIGAASGPLQSASRTLMARIAPEDQRTQFFGLYALSGKLTSFLGPFAVATVTAVTGDVTLGVAVLVIFLVVGFLGLLRVEAV